VARYGGEEFLIIFPEICLEDAVPAVDRIRQKIFDSTGVTISFGVTEFCNDFDSWRAVVEKADQALYLAKEQGRNRVVCLK